MRRLNFGKWIYILCLSLVAINLTYSLNLKAEEEGLMNRLFAPGPLTKGHDNLEGPKDCQKCHDAGKGISDEKCMECHKEIKSYVVLKKGYHGLLTQSCRECHADHKGREHSSTEFDIKTFDHKKTGYFLEGKHATLKCQECHNQPRGPKRNRPNDKKYFGSATTCRECHAKEDIHFYTGEYAKKDCAACHGLRKWDEDVKFDHKKDAKYELMGSHATLECKDCHNPNEKNPKASVYKWPKLGSVQCLACHENYHRSNLSPKYQSGKCTTCHNQDDWKMPKFEHEITGYKLVGHHAKIDCLECHLNPKVKANEKAPTKVKFIDLKNKNINWTGLGKQCLSCHDNYHKSNLSPKYNGKCLSCHNQNEWKIPKFDHEITGYVLKGKHAELDCLECHLPSKSKVANGVQQKVAYSELKNKNVKWSGLGSQCLSCHDDFHRFGHYKSPSSIKYGQCVSCHNESNWKKVHDFNHNATTRYAIDGEHRKLKCSECHLSQFKKPILKPEPGIYVWPKLNEKTCENCHKSPHIGKFPKKLLEAKCTQCHITEGWGVVKPNKDFDHNKTRFALTGKHIKVTCTQCHVKNKKQVFHWDSPPEKGFCIECHQNVHNDQFHEKFSGQTCTECHDTQSFSKRKPFDHDTTAFKISGAHGKLDCNRCHVQTQEVFPIKPPKYMSQFKFPSLAKDSCLACHKDVHAGQLGKDCLKCHTDTTWKNPKFDHQTQTKYPLVGKHTDVKCEKCHTQQGKETVTEFKRVVPIIHYKPINTQCLSCHKDYHKGHFGNQCASCHSEQSWKTTKDFHKDYTLTGAHFTLQCTECHGQNRKLAGLSQQCIFCHKKDDVHSGTLPECGQCHLQVYWEDSKFRHSMTTFPLKGAHRVLECQSCHQTGIYQGLSTACIACHLTTYQTALSPINHTGFSTSCNDCHHNPFAW